MTLAVEEEYQMVQSLQTPSIANKEDIERLVLSHDPQSR